MVPRPENDLFDSKIKKKQKEWDAMNERFPEEQVFDLADLVNLYQNYSEQSEVIKEFVETIKEIIELGSHDPFHFFQIDYHNNYAVLFFDTEENGNSFDLVVKDLNSNQLMPVVLTNCQDTVAFDKQNAFFYCQVDAYGRGKNVFRHIIGTV